MSNDRLLTGVEQMCKPCLFKKVDGSCRVPEISSSDRGERARIGLCGDAEVENSSNKRIKVSRILIGGLWYSQEI